MKKSPKIPKKYTCIVCDYNTSNLKDYNKHKLTRKHEILTNPNKKSPKRFVCDCGKSYKHRSSLSYHKKRCSVSDEINNNKNNSENSDIMIKQLDSNIQLTEKCDDRKLIMKLLDENRELTNKIVEIAQKPHHTTINKPQFNLNIFLNETCKDAINMSEFIKNITIGIQELEFTKENGIADGISSILVNGLKQLDIDKRPIHCTDIKRKTLYIKDEDSWGKDNKEIIERSISNVKKKHTEAIKEWETQHPNWHQSNDETQEYLDFVRSVVGNINDNEENRIISTISKEVDIKDIKDTVNPLTIDIN